MQFLKPAFVAEKCADHAYRTFVLSVGYYTFSPLIFMDLNNSYA